MKKALAVMVTFLVVFSAGCIETIGMSAAKFVRATNGIHSADYSLSLSMVASIHSPLVNTTVKQFIHATGAFDRIKHLQTGNTTMISHTVAGKKVLNLTFFQNGSMSYIRIGKTWFKFRINKNQSLGISNMSALFKFLSEIAKNGTIKKTSSGYVFKASLTNSSLKEMMKLDLLTITHENATARVKVNSGFIEAKLKNDGTPYWIHELINITLMEASGGIKVSMNPVFNITISLSNINSARVTPPEGIENAISVTPSAIKAFNMSFPPLNRKLLIGTESLTKYYVSMDQEFPMSLLTSSVHVNALVDESRGVALENLSMNTLTTNVSVYINGSKLQVLSGNAVIGNIISGNVTVKGMPASASFFMKYAKMAKRLLETALEHSNLTLSQASGHYTIKGNVSAGTVMKVLNVRVTGTSIKATLVANFTKEYRPISYVIEIKSPLGPVMTIKARFKELPTNFKIVPSKKG